VPGLTSSNACSYPVNAEQETGRCGLVQQVSRRGSGPDEQAHEQPEIVPGDMDQIALVDILPAPQPRPAQTRRLRHFVNGLLVLLRHERV